VLVDCVEAKNFSECFDDSGEDRINVKFAIPLNASSVKVVFRTVSGPVERNITVNLDLLSFDEVVEMARKELESKNGRCGLRLLEMAENGSITAALALRRAFTSNATIILFYMLCNSSHYWKTAYMLDSEGKFWLSALLDIYAMTRNEWIGKILKRCGVI